jgi:hypothetical protein
MIPEGLGRGIPGDCVKSCVLNPDQRFGMRKAWTVPATLLRFPAVALDGPQSGMLPFA